MEFDLKNILMLSNKDHRIFIQYVSQFDRFLKNSQFDKLFNTVSELTEFMTKDTFEHFRREEDVFFIAALMITQDEDILSLILKLQKEHGSFENDIQYIMKISNQSEQTKNDNNPLALDKLKTFLLKLKTHAEREDKLFSKIFNGKKEAQLLLPKLINKFESKNKKA